MVEIVYSRTRPALSEGQEFRNPRFFAGAEEGVTKVLLDGDYPEITRAYIATGATVSRIDPLIVEGPASELPPHEPGSVVIPDDWSDLPWTQRSGEGTSLRALASAISDGPVTNKADAIAVVEAELARREG